MSMAIKASTVRARSGQFGANIQGAQMRAALQGDPGLFGFLGDAFRKGVSFIRDPVGTIAGTIAGVLTGSQGLSGGPGNGQVVTNGQIISSGPIVAQSGFQQQPIIDINFPFQGEPGIGVTFNPFGSQSSPSTALGVQNGNGACAVGSHLNKSSYFLKNGTFIQKGSRCVKNRRRNPLNPQAASRAISRLVSAKKATRSIDRFSIKCRAHGHSRCKVC